MKYRLFKYSKYNTTYIYFISALVFILNFSNAHASSLNCVFDPYATIKNVKNNSKTAVFIGKVTSIEENPAPNEGIMATFDPYIQWLGQYNTLHITQSNDPSDNKIKVLVRKITPWTHMFGNNDGENNNIPKELPFFPKLNETYFIVADKDENYKHHYIQNHCHGSFTIDYSLLKMIDRFKLLDQPTPNNVNQKVEADQVFPASVSLPPEYECPKLNVKESFESSTDVFEGTVIRYKHAYSKKSYPAVNIPDFKDYNPEYDYFNIAEYDFIVHRSWKGGFVRSLATNFNHRDDLAVGMRKIYTFNEDRWCGMFKNDTGCGIKLKEGERYIIYSDNSHMNGKSSHHLLDMMNDIDFKKAPYSAITKCSRIVKGDEIEREIEYLQKPLYEINYKKESY